MKFNFSLKTIYIRYGQMVEIRRRQITGWRTLLSEGPYVSQGD